MRDDDRRLPGQAAANAADTADPPPPRRGGLKAGLCALLWTLGLPGRAAPAAQASTASKRGFTDADISPLRRLRFPRDFGAHPPTRTEWWYLTGWLSAPGRGAGDTPLFGFQVTFFRSRTAVDAGHPSAFAAKQLVFAHAALTDLAEQRLRHDDRIARAGFGLAGAATTDTDVNLRGWSLQRQAAGGEGGGEGGSLYQIEVDSPRAGFSLDLHARSTQPLLLQGQAGHSRKGPRPGQASHYYSQPQLAIHGRVSRDGRPQPVQGQAWLDHEWSNALLDADAVGWDWIGMNLLDGGALTAFRLRRADGGTVYAGGSFRPQDGKTMAFAADQVAFTPGRAWTSPHSNARYPVQWRVTTPAGEFQVRALLDAQELDSRGSTGAIYWEGLSELLDGQGRRLGWGYLEMTGYAARLKI